MYPPRLLVPGVILLWSFAAAAAPLRVALPSYPTHLHYAVSPQGQARVINALVAETLVAKNLHSGQLEPRLASRVTIEKTDQSWLFELDAQARFHDGEQVKASDVLFSWDLIFASDSKALALKELLKNWERPIALSESRLRFRAKTKQYGMLQGLEDFYILSSKSHARSGYSRTQLIGSGPFVLTFVEDGKSVGARYNDAYWGRERAWAKDFPKANSLEFTVETDPRLAWERMKLGQFDYMYVLSASLWTHSIKKDAPANPNLTPVEFRSKEPAGVEVLLWNQRHPVLKDQQVRCALQAMMDRDFWMEKLFSNVYEPAQGLFPSASAAHDPHLRPLSFQPRKAGERLDRAGWRRGPDGVRAKNGTRLSFELLLDNPAQERFASVFQEELRLNGVEMILRTLDWASAKQRLSQHRFDGALVYRSDPGFDVLEEEFASWNTTLVPSLNRTGFADKDVDRWLKTLRTSFSETKRNTLYRNIERRVVESCTVGLGWENALTRTVVTRTSLDRPIPPHADWTNAFWSLKKASESVASLKPAKATPK